MFLNFFNSQAKTVVWAAFILGAAGLVSRVLGLIRDRLLAGKFGAGDELDVYFAAFRIPDFIYGILIVGGITAVFLPAFSEYFQKNKEQAWEFANNLLNCLLVLLVFSCLILFIFAPLIIDLVVPGFSPEKKELTVSLTRIMFLSPLFFGISSIFSGILHYFNRFLIFSLAPILYNLSIIFGILFLVPIFGLYGLAYGVILGAFLQMLLQIPGVINSGYKYLPILRFKDPGLIKVFKLMIPRMISVFGHYINLIIVTAIASGLAVGSVTILNFANNLQRLPIGLIGISFALASFPSLSRAWANKTKQTFFKNFSLIFRQILFLIIPISLLMFLMRTQIIQIVLGTGKFGLEETRLTAAMLGIFCLGIFAAACLPFFAKVFYSIKDTKTPTIIALSSIALNIVLCFLFVWLLAPGINVFREIVINLLNLQELTDIAVIGLALALSISGIFHFFLLLFFLKKRLSEEDKSSSSTFRSAHVKEIDFKEIWQSLKKIIIASILMGTSVYFSKQILADLINVALLPGLIFQTITAGFIGVFVYLLTAYFLKCREIKNIRRLITW